MYFVRFIGLGNKLDAESCDPRTGVAHTDGPRISTQRLRIERGQCGIAKTVGFKRTRHEASEFSGPPRIGGGASSWVQVQLGCGLVGHAGDRGTVPSQQDAQELRRVPTNE